MMLRQAQRQQSHLLKSYQAMWTRQLQIFELFNKEKSAERKAKLKEEMDRGYFDDFRSYRDSGGKVFLASERLVPAKEARPFPQLRVWLPDGSQAEFPSAPAALPDSSASDSDRSSSGSSSSSNGPSSSSSNNSSTSVAASLVCIACRAGAQDMLDAWSRPFAERFAPQEPGSGTDTPAQVDYYELALIDSKVMAMFPFRGVLLRSAAAQASTTSLPLKPHHLFHFGTATEARKQLLMTNMLTGYAYLLDSQRRVRWKGSGAPTAQEVASLLTCTQQLMQQQDQY